MPFPSTTLADPTFKVWIENPLCADDVQLAVKPPLIWAFGTLTVPVTFPGAKVAETGLVAEVTESRSNGGAGTTAISARGGSFLTSVNRKSIRLMNAGLKN